MSRTAFLLVLLCGCGEHAKLHGDSAIDVVSASDSLTSDGSIDGCPFGSTDASVAVASPACTTAPSMLLDVSPSRISTIALAGGVLYASSVDYNFSGSVMAGHIIAVDLASGNKSTVMDVTGAGATVWPAAEGWVYFTVGTSPGAIYRVRPGVAPSLVIGNLTSPGFVTADATNVYWSQQDSSTTTAIYTRALCGGPTTTLIPSCAHAQALVVDDQYLYCGEFTPTTSIWRVAKDGSSMATVIGGATYGWTSLIRVGNQLYGVDVGETTVFNTPTPNGPTATFAAGGFIGRFTGMAASDGYFYIDDSSSDGVYRVNRNTKTITHIVSNMIAEYSPVVWNGQLFFPVADSYVMHCID